MARMNQATVLILTASFAVANIHAAQPARKSTPEANDLIEVRIKRTQPLPTGTEMCLLGRDAKGYPVPRVAVKSSEIEFFDDDGNVKKRVIRLTQDNQNIKTRIYNGRQEKTIGVHITKGFSSKRESWTSGEYFIFDLDGRQTLHLEKFNDNTQPMPAPSGDYAVGWPGPTTPGGPPIFYDASGVRNKWAKGFSGTGWPDGFEVSNVEFSDNGQMVGVEARHGRKRRALVFSSSGDKLFELENGGRVLFSPTKGNLAFYKWGHGVGFADISGKESEGPSIEAFPEKFSSDGRRLLARSGGFLAMIDVETGKELWRWSRTQGQIPGKDSSGKAIQTKTPQFSLRKVDATEDFSLIVVLGMTMRFEYPNPNQPQRRLAVDKDHIFFIDAGGKLLREETLPGGTFSTPEAAIKLSADGSTVVVAGSDKVSHFSIVRGTPRQ